MPSANSTSASTTVEIILNTFVTVTVHTNQTASNTSIGSTTKSVSDTLNRSPSTSATPLTHSAPGKATVPVVNAVYALLDNFPVPNGKQKMEKRGKGGLIGKIGGIVNDLLPDHDKPKDEKKPEPKTGFKPEPTKIDPP